MDDLESISKHGSTRRKPVVEIFKFANFDVVVDAMNSDESMMSTRFGE
jgi:hypothetical protein